MITYPTQPEIWRRPVPPSYTELLTIVQDLQRRVAALEARQNASAPHGAPQDDRAEFCTLKR